MNLSYLKPRARKMVATVVSAAAVLVASDLAFAMEPTPSQPTTGSPQAVTNSDTPVATRIIVKYKDSAANQVLNQGAAVRAAQSLSTTAGVELRHIRVMSGNAQVVEVAGVAGMERAQAIQTIEAVANRIQSDPAVEYAEPDAIMQIQQSADDPLFNQQWHYTLPNSGVNLVDGWSNSTGNGIVIGVIDTGFRPHADLVANLLPGFDFISDAARARDGNARDADASDEGDWMAANACGSGSPPTARNSSWHGTHVAGTVAAVTNNTLGVAAIARSAKVVPVRALGKCGGSLSDIADGMRWAAGLPAPGAPSNPNPAQVINLSLGGSGSCGPTYQNAIDDIVASGTTIVISAGNSQANAANFRPANCNGVITVAATNQQGALSWYSNFGSIVDIAAPGGETHQVTNRGVLSTLNSGATTPGADTYAFYQGTSMAAPHVAGVAAQVYQLHPGISPNEVLAILQQTAQPFPSVASNQCSTASCGAGIVDAGAATSDSSPELIALPWLDLLLKQ